ncbi:DUF3099 domain-containing protein [Nocardioides insulae]|uniref:DUF3099 domain-containing protein n=1 Tax=Nocardioides insulae TaxID=394734 RepID=UPI0004210E31|nr:DUF3099 domain-containing protein [Nocardioides insulae]
MARAPFGRDDEAIRITTAPTTHGEDIAGRQRAYLVSMSIRALCFVAAGVTAMNGLVWVWPFLIVAALVLPYVAVVMANAAHTRGEDLTLRDSPFTSHQLRGGSKG